MIMPLTCRYPASMIAPSRTLARIRHTGGRSGLRRSTVNPALDSSSRDRPVRSPRCLLPSGSLVDAALLVVSGGSRVPKASRSDGVAAFDAVGAAWTINGGGRAVTRVGPCAGSWDSAPAWPMTSGNTQGGGHPSGGRSRTGPVTQRRPHGATLPKTSSPARRGGIRSDRRPGAGPCTAWCCRPGCPARPVPAWADERARAGLTTTVAGLPEPCPTAGTGAKVGGDLQTYRAVRLAQRCRPAP